MAFLQKVQKWVETINTYYAFALLLYPILLYVSKYHHLFLWIFAIATPVLAGWSGYLLKSVMERRNERHGFRVLKDEMIYEIENPHHAVLRFNTTIKAGADYLMVYPVGYQWTGEGEEVTPRVTGKNQHLLAHVTNQRGKFGAVKMMPYKTDGVSADRGWHYWFVALDSPAYRGDTMKIQYEQDFHDKKRRAHPYAGYFVRTPLKRLEIKVKFPDNTPKQKVTGYYFHPSDLSHPISTKGVGYDTTHKLATWTLVKPKKGYYRIQWTQDKT